MKTLLNSFLLVTLVIFTATCRNTNNTNDQMEVTGTIQEQGMTSYQYGTHTLTNSETFYALKSDVMDLDDYLNEEVTVRAERVEGYPIENGPVYLRVLEVVKR